MKNIFFITCLFIIYGCGYTPVYKNLVNQDLKINITKMQGDKEMNNLIRNEMNLYSNKNSINKYDITVETKYSKQTLAKDASGTATDYKISINSSFLLSINGKYRQITYDDSIKIKSQRDSFEQNLYEKNIKKNFASSIREKLISEIINFK